MLSVSWIASAYLAWMVRHERRLRTLHPSGFFSGDIQRGQVSESTAALESEAGQFVIYTCEILSEDIGGPECQDRAKLAIAKYITKK